MPCPTVTKPGGPVTKPDGLDEPLHFCAAGNYPDIETAYTLAGATASDDDCTAGIFFPRTYS